MKPGAVTTIDTVSALLVPGIQSVLLADFYRSWLARASKARALRAAELTLLADLRAGTVRIETPAGTIAVPEHPVFWAGFVLIGEPD